MASRSSLDSTVQESQPRERLGPALGPPLVLSPRPLRSDLPAIVLLGTVLGLLATLVRLLASPRGMLALMAYGLAATAAAAGPVVILILRRTRRPRLTPFERGLILDSGGRQRTVLYENLQALEVREREVSGGLIRSIAFTGRQGLRARFTAFARHGAEDRLGGVLIHLLALQVEILEKRVRAGGVVVGWDWVLSGDGLSAPADDHPVPLAEIGAVTLRRNKVAVWRPGERYPFFVVPGDTANALLLVALISRRLEERGEV